MNEIISKQTLSVNVKRMEVSAPEIAKAAKSGQFIVLRVNALGERIPLTIAGINKEKGTITIVFQEIGKTTKLLGTLNAGDCIKDLLGPLGHPTEPQSGKHIVAIGGGVGVAEILPVARFYKGLSNTVTGIIGARSKDLIIFEDEMAHACDNFFITTDDGSYKRKGFVSDVLKELIAGPNKIDIVYAIGPVPMMKFICDITKPHNIKTIVSLNPIMLDGTGMCGVCRCTVEGKTKFACVDGPEFDGHLVNWAEFSTRLGTFKSEEKISNDNFIVQGQK